MEGIDTAAIRAWCADGKLWVDLEDGRTIGAPLAWFPLLAGATAEQLQNVELSRGGIHWPLLDEDISIEGLLAGKGDEAMR